MTWLKTTTGDKLLDYFFYYRGGTIELMTPPEYLDLCKSLSPAMSTAVTCPDESKIGSITQLITTGAVKFTTPFISFKFKCQDGIHRMTSLMHLYGDKILVPVFCVR